MWVDASHRGIVSVVTGGGKTVFALACMQLLRPDTTLVVVPTTALLDQWWEEAANVLALPPDEIAIVEGKGKVVQGTVNIAVLNTAAKLARDGRVPPTFLVVDECHRAAAPTFSEILSVQKLAALGLSATPERPYDDGLRQILVPALGEVIYEYTYREALADGVIVSFDLRNVVFDLEKDCQVAYDRLTKAIARAIQRHGPDAEETVALLLKRARVLGRSVNRVKLAVRLALDQADARVLIFHEDIAACEAIYQLIAGMGKNAALYHSGLSGQERVEALRRYRSGSSRILVTCRALDEGLNVPETEVAIIAASTATKRQRVQRLGRVLRPAIGKTSAAVYTLVAVPPEVARLKDEERFLEGVASVTWIKA